MTEMLLPASHHLAKRLAKQLKAGMPGSIPVVSRGRNSRCYWNADDFVAANGGRVVHGWQLSYWPGLYAKALHHAAVMSEDNKIVDVTTPDRNGDNTTTFCVDERVAPSREYPEYIPSEFLIINKCDAVVRLIGAIRRHENANRAISEEVKAQGAKFIFDKPMDVQMNDRLAWAINEKNLAKIEGGRAADLCRAIAQRR